MTKTINFYGYPSAEGLFPVGNRRANRLPYRAGELRWLARAIPSKIGDLPVEAAAKALMEKDLSDEAREEVLKILQSPK